MCLGMPARIIETEDDRGTPMGIVDFGGVTKRVCLVYVPEAEIGEFVIVHAGFAITRLDRDAAEASLDLFEEIGLLRAPSDPPMGEVGA